MKDLNLNELKLRHTVKCYCGQELEYNNVKPPIYMNTKYHHYYGGRAKMYCIIECAKCGRQYIALVEDNYKVFDTAILLNHFRDVTQMAEVVTPKIDKMVKDTVDYLVNPVARENRTTELDKINMQEEISDFEEIEEDNSSIEGIQEEIGQNSDEEKYVCPKCGKVCKSQVGLASHCRKCATE